MMYDLYIEKQRADINQTLSIQLSYAIDDIRQFGTRNTSFSKSITLPGTARNNKLFGHILLSTTANDYEVSLPNIDVNFNPADISLCEVRQQGLLVLKGIFRLTGYKLNKGVYEYEGTIFGELGGFVSSIGNSRLEDLDFSTYDHVYNTTNIAASWDNAGGSGYYYPLIDYGTFSTNKIDYDINTMRPALYVKEYIDKIFAASGYTYESDFFETAFFKSIIIPHNTKRLTKLVSEILNAVVTGYNQIVDVDITSSFLAVTFDSYTGGNFEDFGLLTDFVWTPSITTQATISLTINGSVSADSSGATIEIQHNGLILNAILIPPFGGAVNETITADVILEQNDQINVVVRTLGSAATFSFDATLKVNSFPAVLSFINVGDTVVVNDTIPKGIFQKDFFSWILRMFNLYVDEAKLTDRHLIIKPYVDYYNYSDRLDWSQKIDYSKVLDFTPMGQLNGRFFEYKYKQDSDFYNEAYQKKFNQSYGDLLHDTGFPFSKDKQPIDIGFSPTPLVKYVGTDKYVPAIYKKSTGNDIDQEELTDSNIRILVAKKITGVASWKIKDGVTDLSTQTVYGYAGHLNDPVNPTKDLNFGAPSEIYFTIDVYTGNGLYNVYWASYIDEITNKDSKILSCHAYLKGNDIADLDFSKPIYISGSLWRINKIEDYDAENPVTRVELLKIINADNG